MTFPAELSSAANAKWRPLPDSHLMITHRRAPLSITNKCFELKPRIGQAWAQCYLLGANGYDWRRGGGGALTPTFERFPPDVRPLTPCVAGIFAVVVVEVRAAINVLCRNEKSWEVSMAVSRTCGAVFVQVTTKTHFLPVFFTGVSYGVYEAARVNQNAFMTFEHAFIWTHALNDPLHSHLPGEST